MIDSILYFLFNYKLLKLTSKSKLKLSFEIDCSNDPIVIKPFSSKFLQFWIICLKSSTLLFISTPCFSF